MIVLKKLARRGARPCADAIDRRQFAFPVHPDDHRSDARDVHLVAMHNAQDKGRGDACVDRVAAGLQDFERGLGREIVTS